MNAKRIAALAGITIAGLALTGCGGVEKDATYGSVAELQEVLTEETSVKCDESESAKTETIELVMCDDTVFLAVWPEDSSPRVASFVEQYIGAYDIEYVRGPNWMVASTDSYVLSEVEETLGGTNGGVDNAI